MPFLETREGLLATLTARKLSFFHFLSQLISGHSSRPTRRVNNIAMRYCTTTLASPVGTLTLIAGAEGLAAVFWENDPPERMHLDELTASRDHPFLLQASRELREYFAGRRTSFSIPLDPVGTDFQKKVWAALLSIPYGQTRSYGELAKQVGKPKAARAVGAANAKNPLAIVIPCHRAIGSNGALVGFAGGLEAKRYLLSLEATACHAGCDPAFIMSR